MLTLSLLRHAKSDWADPRLEDFDRPLAKRGRKAAPEMAEQMIAAKLEPELVLCSAAKRTRETLALIADALSGKPKIKYEEELYLAPAMTLLERLRKVKKGIGHVLMIGHNPGLQALALELTLDGSREDIRALAIKFPTAALAVLTFPVEAWSEIGPASGHLVRLVTPQKAG